ncbi:complement factor B-like isoform X1 [Stegostoma tigrinum]|uniref:complement factor B-like isoform X1 n=2 Tax=Stegostoma tigrinum TaxID=3053191 RepID=UPI00202B9009|nr:complement factor B-like isoform X1 [Stegostoma tigrinum]
MASQFSTFFSWARLNGQIMEFILLLTIGVLPAVISEDQLCSNDEVIQGGRIEWPTSPVKGSVMTYICPVGFRPYPVSWRYCTRFGNWSRLRNVYHKTALEATCKEIKCLRPEQFEFGIYDPVKSIYKVNDSITFQCFDGYLLIGSATITCLPNGHWSGNLPRCDAGGTFCSNPGIPFGARKSGTSYGVLSMVQYNCGTYILRGSKQRTCLETGQWSGVEPRCESREAFDDVEDLAKVLNILLSTIRNRDLNSGAQIPGRKRKVDVFFVIDASITVGNENFLRSFKFVKTFINRVSDMKGMVRYEVIAFGSCPIVITNIRENLTPKAVMERIAQVEYRDYFNNTGRRTGPALEVVYSSINKTVNLHAGDGQAIPKQVIILITAGQYNGSPAPFIVTEKISNLVSHLPDHLDIVVIGIGEVFKDHLEHLVPTTLRSTKRHQYAFYLPSYHYLEKAQEVQKKHGNTQLSDCGIRGNTVQRPVSRIFGGIKSKEYEWPWQVIINLKNNEICGGSIISKRWILSAAHCFNGSREMTNILTIQTGSVNRKKMSREFQVVEVIIHENFSRPSEMNNDIALLKTKDPILFDAHVRPVCLPCTKKSAELLSSAAGSWDEACHYEDGLLTSHGGRNQKIMSGFITGWGYYKKHGYISSFNLNHAQVNIEHFRSCDSPYPLTDNIFCAKGATTDSCTGDSGGPFVMERNRRWIQVGIISFGRTPVCGVNFMGFYSNVPKLMRWIRERVTDLEYE